MIGMNPHTGRASRGLDHLFQSVAQILGTPRGTRIQRRPFGADLDLMIDAPANPANLVRAYAAVATALMRWEPRLKLTRVGISSAGDDGSSPVIDIHGIANESGTPFSTRVQINARRAA